MEYSCAKCGEDQFETAVIRTTGSGITRFLNVQNQRFGTVTCKACNYTEMYRLKSAGRIANIFDVLTN